VSPIPRIGIEDPFPIITKLAPLYLRRLVNIPNCPIILLEALMSVVHSVSARVLSVVKAASACCISSLMEDLFGIP
jgi:hypothetical protein